MTTTAHEDQFGEATEKHTAMYSIEEILRRNVADLELELQRQRERAETAEGEMRKAREQEPVGEIHFPPNNQPLEVFWYGENPNYAVRIGIYADPKPAAASIVDDAIAQRIALAVYDYQNRISDEPLMHAINNILAKEANSISSQPPALAVLTDEQIHAAYREALGQSIRERDMPEIRKFARALLGAKP